MARWRLHAAFIARPPRVVQQMLAYVHLHAPQGRRDCGGGKCGRQWQGGGARRPGGALPDAPGRTRRGADCAGGSARSDILGVRLRVRIRWGSSSCGGESVAAGCAPSRGMAANFAARDDFTYGPNRLLAAIEGACHGSRPATQVQAQLIFCSRHLIQHCRGILASPHVKWI